MRAWLHTRIWFSTVGIFDHKHWGNAIVGVKISRKLVKSHREPGAPEELMVPLKELRGKKIQRIR